MKKRSLTISTILFSSMLLGTVIANPSEVYSDTSNESSEITQADEVENNVKFINDNGEKVGTDTISGELNSNFDFDDLKIPSGYKLATNNEKITITKNGNHVIVVNALKIQNTIKFVDSKTEKVIDESKIDGLTGESYSIASKLPDGYKTNSAPSIVISGTQKVQEVSVYKVVTNVNKIQWVDESGNVIRDEDIAGEVGTSDNGAVINWMPYGYEAIDGQSLTVHFKKGYVTHTFKVRKIKKETPKVYTNLFEFRDYYDQNNKSISTYKKTGNEGDKVVFPNNIISKDYELFSTGEYRISETPTTFTVYVIKIITNNVEFVNVAGEKVGEESIKGGENSEQPLTAPSGYKLITNLDNVTLSVKKPNKTILVVPEKGNSNQVTVQISFVDSKNNEKVTTGSVSGEQGTRQEILIPNGYKVSDGYSNFVNMDKNTHLLTIKVDKIGDTSKATTTDSDTVVKAYSAKVSTHASMNVPLFNKDGKRIKNRALAGNSNWHVDKKMTLKGQVFYRVATDEWVQAENVYEYTVNKAVINTTDGSYKNLYNSKGVRNTTRALASNSSWTTDKTATINDQKMYRVATDEWVSAADIK